MLSPSRILIESFQVFRRAWLHLVVTDLLARAVGVTVSTTLVGLLLKVFLMTTPEGVVTDDAIVSFLLHPAGFLALLVVGSVSLAILFIELGQLMVVGYSGALGRPVTWLDACLYTYRHGRDLLRCAWFAVIRLLWVTLPSVAVAGVLYLVFLQEYDINYYLARRPPVFLWVAGVAGVAFVVMALRVLWQLAGWLVALPLVLFEGMGGRRALVESVGLLGGVRLQLAGCLLAWFLGLWGVLVGVTYFVGLLGGWLVPREDAGTLRLLFGLGGLLMVAWLIHLVVSILSTVLFPLCVVGVYRSLARPDQFSVSRVGRGVERGWLGVPGKPVLLGAAAMVVTVAFGGYSLLRAMDKDDDSVIIAHRGGAAVAPENTMAAFRRGIQDEADWLELDVQEDAAGRVVVLHDRDLMRVAGASLEIARARESDLARLDVGSFFDAAFANERVPTLREVLELAKGKAGIFIELKYYGRERRLEERVVEVVEELGMADRIVLMSLKYDGLHKAMSMRPGWKGGVLNAVAVGDITRFRVNFLALTSKAATRPLIKRAHARGLKVYAWTVNDPVQMSVMLSRGVDGLITDQVAMARRVLEVRQHLSPLGRFLIWMAGEAGLLSGNEVSSDPDDA